MLKILFLLLIVSCGKIKVETTPVTVDANIPKSVAFGPDFEKAIQVCDDRYGKGTINSEDCFQDYRKYLNPKIGFDLDSIASFCKNQYTTEVDIKGCQEDLLDTLSKVKI